MDTLGFTLGDLIETIILAIGAITIIGLWLVKPSVANPKRSRVVLYITAITILLVIAFNIISLVTLNRTEATSAELTELDKAFHDYLKRGDINTYIELHSARLGERSQEAKRQQCADQNALNTPISCLTASNPVP